MSATAVLLADLALAAAAEPPHQVASAATEADPLRLNLPPLGPQRAGPEALRALSALYLAERLEEIGLLDAAESLVHLRATLQVPASTAAQLEDFARRQLQDFPREQRMLLYARLFGLGPGIDSAVVNTRFEPLLAGLCSALTAWAQPPADSAQRRHAAVAQAGRDLADAAGIGYADGVVLTVPVINDQLRRAVRLLSDPGIGALVGARGLWATVRALIEPNVADQRRLLDAGRAGQRVLNWLADVLTSFEQAAPNAAVTLPAVVTDAAAWLAAYGLLDSRSRGTGPG